MIPTPNIDRLASQGMRFTDAHSSSGVSSPSRYALLTGRYHWRTRLQKGIVEVFGQPLIAPDRMTIVTLAKQNGYRTAAIGKWHLGWGWPIAPEQRKHITGAGKRKGGEVAPDERQLAAWRDVFSKPLSGGPTARGFDHYVMAAGNTFRHPVRVVGAPAATHHSPCNFTTSRKTLVKPATSPPPCRRQSQR